MTIHVGILGAGGISESHARAAGEIPGVRMMAVHGRNRERAARLAAAYGAVAYDDLTAFLAHRPLDLVMIGSPSGLHAEQGIAAARAGLHVLVEKPIDISTARADALGATVIAYLLTGPAVFGAIGWGLDTLLGTGFLVVVGILAGMALSLYVIWLRYGTS